jgi:DNA repair exonuclease SbcCD ATPase subunit
VKEAPIVLSSQRDAADLQRARQQLAAQEAQIAAAREQLAIRQQQQQELAALLELKGHALVEALVQVLAQLESLDQSGQTGDGGFTTPSKRHAAVDVDFTQLEHNDQDEAQAAPEARLLSALGRLRSKQEALQQLVVRLSSSLEASRAEVKGLEQQLEEVHVQQKAQEAQSKAQVLIHSCGTVCSPGTCAAHSGSRQLHSSMCYASNVTS